MASWYAKGRTCQCGATITDYNKSGKCRPCVRASILRSPETEARRAEGIRRKYREDPAYRAKMQAIMKRVGQKAGIDPEITARRREQGKWMYENVLNTPENRAKVLATRPAVAEKLREQKLGWCPPDLRDEYQRLYRNKHIKAAKARAIIEQKIADREALKHIDSALYFLNRLAPTAKLENGYRYGNAILRPSEVIERAKLRGWQPDRWAA